MSENEIYMQRCLQLAACGLGTTSPNPMVGALLVCDGKIIGEGFHVQSGSPHAEVNAINSVKDPDLLTKSTLYVSLEPCSHYGKTPPCAKLIIDKKIPKVVVACLDPNPQVSGRGINMLREAGVEVVTGVLEQEARTLNKRFICYQENHRPYIILKWAQSLDGFIDKNDEHPVRLSDDRNLLEVHKMRAVEDAILVGKNTALKDNPSLTARLYAGKNPIRLLIDRRLQVPQTTHLYDGDVPTIVFCERKGDSSKVEYVELDFSKDTTQQILEYLYKINVQSLIVEGGCETLQRFIDAELWDEARIEYAPVVLCTGISAPKIDLKSAEIEQVGTSKVVHILKNKKYFSK